MPTYYRPKVAHVDPGGADVGGLVLIAAGVAAAAAVVAFILAHLILLAAAAGVLIVVPLGSVLALRCCIQPRGVRRWQRAHEAARPALRPARAISAPRPAIGARRAIEAPANAAGAPSAHFEGAGGEHREVTGTTGPGTR